MPRASLLALAFGNFVIGTGTLIVPGTPAGISGSALFHSVTGIEKLDATSPTSTASAFSSSARRRSSARASDSVAATSVRARATSSSATSPARQRRSVSESVSRYASTVVLTSDRSVSAARSAR